MNDEIETVVSNFKIAEKIYDDIEKLKTKESSLKKELEKKNKEKEKIRHGIYPEDKTPLKRTFNEILDEIARQNNISRGNVPIDFKEKICGGYFFRTDESKRETIEKEIKARGDFTLSFSIATNPDCLEKEPIFQIYPLPDKEKKRRKELDNKRKQDALYSSYTYNARPFEIQNNGKKMIDLLHRKDGFSAEMFWFFNVDKYYGEIFYYIEPKYINLDEENPFSKAIKKLLTEEELKKYYKDKEKYEAYINNRKELIKSEEEKAKKLKEEISKIEKEIIQKKKEISSIKWPIIKIKLGDFIDYIYRSKENDINPNNSEIELLGSIFEDDVNEFSEESFMLRISGKRLNHIFMEDFHWKMNYSEKMYDGKTLYKHYLKNISFKKWSFKNKFRGLKKIQDFVMYFNPKDFFKDNIKYESLSILKEKTILKIIIKCMLLEKVRKNKITMKDTVPLYKKYINLLDNKENPKQIENNNCTKEEGLKKIRENVYEFIDLNQNLQDDKEIVLEVVSIDGLLLKYASERLKGDSKIVLTAIKSNPLAIEFAGITYKNDENLLLDLVKINGLILEFATPRIRDIKEIVLEAIKNNGLALRFASSELKKDRDIVLEAINQNGAAIKFADKSFLNDKRVIIETLKKPNTGFIMSFISEDLRKDKEVILTAYNQDKSLIKYAYGLLKDEIRIYNLKMMADKCLKSKQKVYKR